MKVIRKQEMNVRNFRVGDQIVVGKYTATCQRLYDETAIFLLDQYLDRCYTMTELIEEDFAQIQNDPNIESIKNSMVEFYPKVYLRLPTVGEMFGKNDLYESDSFEQWDLMKDVKNRIAFRAGKYELGWLMNKTKLSSSTFAHVTGLGRAYYNDASNSYGVRPVFQLVRKIGAPRGRKRKEKENEERIQNYIQHDINSLFEMLRNLNCTMDVKDGSKMMFLLKDGATAIIKIMRYDSKNKNKEIKNVKSKMDRDYKKC